MNLKVFKKRLITFYSSWKHNKKDLWSNSDILVMYTPPCSGTSPIPTHTITSSFFIWLLGHDMPNTIAVFTKYEIYFLCTKKRLSMLKNLEDSAMLAVHAKVRVIPKRKKESDLEKMDKILHEIRDTEKRWAADADEIAPLVIGYVYNESPKSKLLWCCANNLKKREFLSAIVTGFSQLLNQNGNDSSHEVEQMLLLAPESKEWKPSKAHDKVLRSDKGGADLSSTAAMYNIVEKASYAKDIARISSEHIFISEEEDEWVLVEG